MASSSTTKPHLDGFETFYRATAPEINDRFQLAVAALHFSIIHSGFKCIGIGEVNYLGFRNRFARYLP